MYIKNKILAINKDYSINIPQVIVKKLKLKPGQKYTFTIANDDDLKFKFL